MNWKVVSFIFCALIFQTNIFSHNLKVLHLSFHKGCVKDFEEVARHLDIDLTTNFILDTKETRYSFDPSPADWKVTRLPMSHPLPEWNAVYNISHERAERIWQTHKDYFSQFDVIITSDTAPLCRIFLQNNWQKPLIIWICNRFDYVDAGSYDGKFPDSEYYDLFRKTAIMPNVKVIGYVAYEHFYAVQKGVYTGSTIIKPCGAVDNENTNFKSFIPEIIKKNETFFIPPRLESHQASHLIAICEYLGLKAYCGKYNGPYDLKDFKGVIHFPYAWSNLALFENIQLGLPHFVPSQKFLVELYRSAERDSYKFFALQNLHLSEWYSSDNKDVIIYFDSWNDLKDKINSIDFPSLHEKVKAFGKKHKQEMVRRWQEIFSSLL